MTADGTDRVEQTAEGAEPSLAAVRAAQARIAPYVIRTPTVRRDELGRLLGRQVSVKLELLQHSGSFKARGAFNKLLLLSDTERAAGVVAVSGGNHGLAVAYAAKALGIPATVFMPSSTTPASVVRARADGAEVVITETIAEAFAASAQAAVAGRTMVHPFDDPAVIAAQGTVALELLEDAPDTTDILVSIGGGGLIGGILTVIGAMRPEIRVWGVETEGADAMAQALAAGHPVLLPRITSIATTLGAPSVSDRTLAIVRDGAADVLVVPDAEAVQAIALLADTVKVVTEPAAACTWSAAVRLGDRLPADARVALVICGGNVGLDDIQRWRAAL